MRREKITKILLSSVLAFSTLPSIALTLDKPPMMDEMANQVKKETPQPKKTVKKVKQKQEGGMFNPLYPAKYTPDYISQIKDEYKSVGKEEVFYVALDMLKDTNGNYSRMAILGTNLTQRPMKLEFKDLGTINKSYANYDALGWKRGKTLYIFINQKHINAPAIALSALLSHEALHQDEFNSLEEETYAWTMEAAVWCELLELYPEFELTLDPLVQREKTLKKIFERGDHTSKYIRKTVYSNDAYKKLPETSPGFESL